METYDEPTFRDPVSIFSCKVLVVLTMSNLVFAAIIIPEDFFIRRSYPNDLKNVVITGGEIDLISHKTTTSGLCSERMMFSRLIDFDLKPLILT